MKYRYVEEKDSFAKWFIDNFGIKKFNNVINHEKNKNEDIDIWHISKRSTCKINFICENKSYHEYSISCDKYYKGVRYKYCGRTKYVHPLDSFAQWVIDNYGENTLNKIWSDKNDKTPFEYSCGTENKVWINCINGLHEPRLRQIKNCIQSELRCPFCSENYNSSILEDKVFNYLNSTQYSINREHNCTLVPKNPKTKMLLPYDNEVVELKLIIEIHGRQHYEEVGKTSKWLNGLTPKEYLYQRKLKDRYKRIYAIQNGYNYLEIPYWEIKNDNWKNIIDNKINEIIRGNND